MSISTLLEVEISDRMEELNNLELGTDEYKSAVESITKLMDRSIETDKLEIEAEEKRECRKEDVQLKTKQMEEDIQLKTKQMKEDTKHRWIDKAISVGTFIGVTALTVWGTNKTLKFEETGTVTTMAGKNYVNKLFSFIKK